MAMTDKETWDVILTAIKTAIGLVGAIAAGIWTFVVWRAERAQDRAEGEAARAEARNRTAALYENPLLHALDALQSRLYNILENDGLVPLRARPHESYAKETVYLLAQYLCWERINLRYGPHARNAECAKYRERVVDALASDRDLPVGPFCFFRNQQQALAEMVLVRTEGPHGSEFDTLPLSGFQPEVGYVARAATETMADLEQASLATDLKGRARMARLQVALVERLEHLETLTNFKLRDVARRKASTSSSASPQSHSTPA